MSKLTDRLRRRAASLYVGHDTYDRDLLREAADTIESLERHIVTNTVIGTMTAPSDRSSETS